ncbi:MAG: hypothetical protein KDK91_01805 [Gammaproteobacteria bacterium]|nr:hypothetical protein [Gammaproteobacteria bacterium]
MQRLTGLGRRLLGRGGAAGGANGRAGWRATDVGWLIDAPSATFIYDAPAPVPLPEPASNHAKSPHACPAILAHRGGLHQIACPLDLHLRVRNLDTPRPVLVNAAGDRSAVSRQVLDQMVTLMPRDRWLHPDRPLLQVSAPWRFVSDANVWLNQLPPFYHYRSEPLPGLMIGGRFPIRLWPRSLMWAFEWHDTQRDLRLRRGEPWFYVWFETEQPQRRVRLLEAQMTDALREYCNGLDGAAAHVNQTYALFRTASQRRPTQLLHKKVRD